jgi:hypothetical protein
MSFCPSSIKLLFYPEGRKKNIRKSEKLSAKSLTMPIKNGSFKQAFQPAALHKQAYGASA